MMGSLRNASSMMLMIFSYALVAQTTISFMMPSVTTRRISPSSLAMSSTADAADSNLVVISPPGGLGEITAVEAAKMGSSVRWFVISPPPTASGAATSSSTSSFSLSPNTLEIITANGGNVDLAGAQADTLLLPSEDSNSAINAVSTWCGAGASASTASGIICTIDGLEEAIGGTTLEQESPKEYFKAKNTMMDAIKVAAREASTALPTSSIKVALAPSTMDLDIEVNEDDSEEKEGGGLLGSIFGSKVEVPSNLASAMKGGKKSSVGSKFVALRYGELFGVPESSPDASPFVGGPRRDPVIRDEYTMKAVRIDPTISVSGNPMMAMDARSSRLSIGEAASRIALSNNNSNDDTKTAMSIMDGLDICLTSLRGLDNLSSQEWSEEINRVQEMLTSGQGAQLFSASFGSVPSVERLADWIATKWAPAVMRTYDIAGIRVGARPVYASRIDGTGLVEIVWQELVDFKTNNVGKMIIEVTESGMTAIRGPGDAKAGYGLTSKKPLAGEGIMVRRLSDAATQAIEKGLATKPAPKKQEKKKVVAAPVVSTVVESGPVAPPAAPASSDSGPRTAGARRSSERQRGKRRKRSSGGSTES